jgi:Sap, sulfolipid-1-addressing protein
VIGVLSLAIAFVLATGRDAVLTRRRTAKRDAGTPKPAWSERMLSRGSAKLTFVAGALLSFPGLSYLAALDSIVKLDVSALPSTLLVLTSCLIQQLLLELPLLGYTFAPERTRAAVTGLRTWLARSGRRAVVIGLTGIGILLITRGLITLSV